MAASANLAPGQPGRACSSRCTDRRPTSRSRHRKPGRAIWSASLMLEHLVSRRRARVAHGAGGGMPRRPRTRDLGGSAGTAEVARRSPRASVRQVARKHKPKRSTSSGTLPGPSPAHSANTRRRSLRIDLADAAQGDQLGKEPLKAGRRDDLEIRAGSSPAFQNVCHWSRGLKIRSPASDTTSSPSRAPTFPRDEAVFVLSRVAVQWSGQRRADIGARPARNARLPRRRRS